MLSSAFATTSTLRQTHPTTHHIYQCDVLTPITLRSDPTDQPNRIYLPSIHHNSRILEFLLLQCLLPTSSHLITCWRADWPPMYLNHTLHTGFASSISHRSAVLSHSSISIIRFPCTRIPYLLVTLRSSLTPVNFFTAQLLRRVRGDTILIPSIRIQIMDHNLIFTSFLFFKFCGFFLHSMFLLSLLFFSLSCFNIVSFVGDVQRSYCWQSVQCTSHTYIHRSRAACMPLEAGLLKTRCGYINTNTHRSPRRTIHTLYRG